MNVSLDDLIKQDRKKSLKKDFQKKKVAAKAPIRKRHLEQLNVGLPGANARDFGKNRSNNRNNMNAVGMRALQ